MWESGREMRFIFVIEDLKYFIAHYTTVTNSDHACAAIPIIDYKQLQWRGSRAQQPKQCRVETGDRWERRERRGKEKQNIARTLRPDQDVTSKLFKTTTRLHCIIIIILVLYYYITSFSRRWSRGVGRLKTEDVQTPPWGSACGSQSQRWQL